MVLDHQKLRCQKVRISEYLITYTQCQNGNLRLALCMQGCAPPSYKP